MNRAVFLARVAAIFLFSALLGVDSFAQTDDELRRLPDMLRHYRFIPSRSSLEVTGGIAGIRQEYFPYGAFDIHTGYRFDPRAFPSEYLPFAKFELDRWDSWLVPNSPLAYVLSTDEVLNLSGLNGTFRPGEPNHLFFRGVDGQGQPFKLMAVQRGRLLHLMGENTPGCCDFFNYKFDAFAHQTPYSDFNVDGRVDRGDLNVLLANIGTRTDARFEQGDADGDGDVDGDDFLTWQREIGAATPLSAFAGDSLAEASLNSAAVPEPATLAIAAAAALFMWLARRK
ncbi:MAG TPA: PEP-CTERM sorting domain-containing protein [Lacipirellulaceae bacterium]|jgi:hypothetical protein|nr:PEP-CTERM sorting domain-containing protein [Lacipirellulaceae bacterium]